MSTAYSSTRSFRAAAVGCSPKVFSCDDSGGWTPRPFTAELPTAATHLPERRATDESREFGTTAFASRSGRALARSAVTRYVTRALDPGGMRPVACATNLPEDSRPVRADFLAGSSDWVVSEDGVSRRGRRS